MNTTLQNISKHKAFLLFVLFVLITFIIPFSYGVRYYNSDDIIRRQLLLGSDQFAQDPNLMVSSRYFGNVLVFLYNTFPKLEWYLIVNSFLVAFSIAIIFYYSTNKTPKDVGIKFFIYTLFLILVGRWMITKVHFTVTSSLLGVVAFLLFKSAVQSKTKTDKLYILRLFVSFSVLTLAASIRFETAMLNFLVSAIIYCIFQFLVYESISSLYRRPNLLIVSHYVALVVFSTIVVKTIERTEHLEYKEFRTTLHNQRQIFDFKIWKNTSKPDDCFLSVGWKEGHKMAFFSYLLPGIEKFNPENLNKLVTFCEKNQITQGKVSTTDFKFFINRYLLDIEYKALFIILPILAFILTLQKGRKVLLSFIISLVFVFSVILILGVKWKFPLEYMSTPLLCNVFFIPTLFNCEKKKIFWFFMFIVTMFSAYFIKKHQSEFIAYCKNLIPFKNLKSKTQDISKTTLICFSQRTFDYAYPLNYNNSFWWVKQNLRNVYYTGPYSWHPACVKQRKGKRDDFIYNSIVSKGADSYWILSHDYQSDFKYDVFDDAIIKYVKDEYNVDVNFEKSNSDKEFDLMRLRLIQPVN